MALIRNLFALIGLGFLAGALYLVVQTRSFVAGAVRSEGTVVGLTQTSRRGGAKPVVSFVDESGQTVQYTGRVGSSPPAYDVGERVVVLHAPGDPRNAKIDGFLDLWFLPTLFGGMGALFFLIGAGMSAAAAARVRRNEVLRRTGRPVQAAFQGVERNTSLRVNGRNPWRVVAQWQDPATSAIHIFTSDNLWYDPTEFIVGEAITVFVDRQNPKRYCVDLSFLPEVAT